jgi:hypothetical protein
MSAAEKITHFPPDVSGEPVTYVETVAVKPGVMCDVYAFPGDSSRDLAIVTVQYKAGCTTPPQGSRRARAGADCAVACR